MHFGFLIVGWESSSWCLDGGGMNIRFQNLGQQMFPIKTINNNGCSLHLLSSVMAFFSDYKY